MSHLIRYRDNSTNEHGVAEVDSDGAFSKLEASFASFTEMLRLEESVFRQRLCDAKRTPLAPELISVLSPCDGRMEVWAAGVTYLRSRDARMEESTERSVYDRVYLADRPELFMKSVAWRVVTSGDDIAARSDSPLNVPEPELALVLNSAAQIVGYTICNDVSSRSIEGDNPLYLPQAKIYEASCAIAAKVRPAWEIEDPYNLAISAQMTRAGTTVWSATSTTAELHRTMDDLVKYLFRQQSFPDGVILSTGTGIVPGMEITMQPGDVVDIDIAQVGTLRNQVVSVDSILSSRASASTVHDLTSTSVASIL